MDHRFSKSEINHLRRLIAWVRCEYFLTPEEVIKVVRDNAAVIGEPSNEGKARLVDWYKEKQRIPKYVHAAIKALEPTVRERSGEVVDAEIVKQRRITKRARRIKQR